MRNNSWVVGIVVGLTVFGTAPWLVMRRLVSWAPWWAAASIAGLVAAWLAVVVIAALAEGAPEALLGLGFGVGYGAVTGAALVWLLRQAAAAAPLAAGS